MSMLTCYAYYSSSEDREIFNELHDISERKRLGMDTAPEHVWRTHDPDGTPIDTKQYAYDVRRPEYQRDGVLEPLLRGRIPAEIFYEVLIHLHPRDLLALRKSSGLFQNYTDPVRRSWIWARARANAPVPIPDPPRIPIARTLWDEESYAVFLFKTQKGCQICGSFTDRLPISFSNRMYVCDNESCFNVLMDGVTDVPEEYISPDKWTYMQHWVPPLEPELFPSAFGFDDGAPLYFRCRLECTAGEWERAERRSQGAPDDGWLPFSCDAPRTMAELLAAYKAREEILPHVMKTSSALQGWGPRFVRYEKGVKDYNYALAAQLSHEVKVTPSILLQSRIYQDHIRWATAGGRRMSYIDWTQIRDAVRAEIIEMAARVASGFFEGAFE